MLLQIPAGKLADKIGRKKAFYLFRPFTYLGTLILILAPTPKYLILVGVLGCFGLFAGGFSQVSFIPFITMNFEMVSEKKRGRWLGIIGLFGILSFPASMLGGIIWQQGLMKEVLLLPLLMEVLIAIPILHRIPDTLKRLR
jgi:MFS family permease